MSHMTIHRYSIPTAEVVRALLDVGDCQEIQTALVGENLIIDVIEPVSAGGRTVEESFAEVEGKTQQVEDEQPAESPAPDEAPVEPARKGGDLARRAGILCNEGAFRLWAEVQTPDAAKAFIYRRCGLESRVDLDHEPEAAAKFRDMIAEYDVWLAMP